MKARLESHGCFVPMTGGPGSSPQPPLHTHTASDTAEKFNSDKIRNHPISACPMKGQRKGGRVLPKHWDGGWSLCWDRWEVATGYLLETPSMCQMRTALGVRGTLQINGKLDTLPKKDELRNIVRGKEGEKGQNTFVWSALCFSEASASALSTQLYTPGIHANQ